METNELIALRRKLAIELIEIRSEIAMKKHDERIKIIQKHNGKC